jgi:hypothetical protein
MKTKVAAVIAVLLGLTATTCAVAAEASGSERHRQAFTLTATTTHEALLDLSTDATDPTGNQFVSAHDVFRDHRKIGTDGASCQVIDVVGTDRLRVQCVASLSLPQGQLTAQGLPVFTEQDTTFTLAITGGTGAYDGARGEVTVRPIDAQHSRYTIVLED